MQRCVSCARDKRSHRGTGLKCVLVRAQLQAKARCVYCSGTGYLPCAQCGTRGKLISREGTSCFCSTCSGTGKVMCTSCLCTGMAMATEHDPRIDPFV